MTLTLEDTIVLEEIPVEGYERVVKATDETTGLKAIISIHNMTLGPALGGTRIYPYATFDAALTDALRLSKGMTYKSAVANAGLGGGKSVIIADPKKDKTEALLLSFGRAVNRLQGSYICAEDIGCSTADVLVIKKATPYVVGLPHDKSSGDPSPFTAWGTYRGIQSVIKKLDGTDSLEGKTVAIQGLGSVGMKLAELLFWAGAKLIVCDLDQERVAKMVHNFRAKGCSPEEILSVPCDVLAPCAMGGILNPKTIPQLRCRAVAGCANNQLLTESDGDALMHRGILYAPDFVINAGGLINVMLEIEPEGYDPIKSRSKVHAIYDQLILVYDIAQKNRVSTSKAAISLGDYRLKYGVGKRESPVCIHHAK